LSLKRELFLFFPEQGKYARRMVVQTRAIKIREKGKADGFFFPQAVERRLEPARSRVSREKKTDLS